MVNRYILALDDKINGLFEELRNEVNSEAWDTMIRNKRLLLDNRSGRSASSPARGRGMGTQGGRSKRGRAGSAGSAEAPRGRGRPPARAAIEDDGEATPPLAPG